MKNAVKKIVDLYIYSGLHISLAASFLTLESYFLFSLPVDHVYILFVFFSTMLIYSLHRIVGLSRLRGKINQGRFLIIRKYEKLIRYCAFISLLGIVILLPFIGFDFIIFFIPAGIISILYTFPIIKTGRRLRDFNYLKIFLIAIVWSYICGILPILQKTLTLDNLVLLSGLEKFIFFIAITLPFDVRDYSIDLESNVKTLAHKLGKKMSWILAGILLFIGLITLILMAYTNEKLNYAAVVTAYLLVGASFLFSKNKSSDYYYSGLLDGMIILRSLVIIISIIVF